MILFCIHIRFNFSGCNESNQDKSERQEHLPDQYFMDYQHQNLEQHPDQDQDSNIDGDRDQEEIEDQDEDEYVYLARERDEVEVEYEDEDYEKELDLWEDLTNFVIEKNVPNNTTAIFHTFTRSCTTKSRSCSSTTSRTNRGVC